MASIYKCKDGKGWRAVIRMKGHPTICDHFDRKQETEDWFQELERQIKLGQYKFDQHKNSIPSMSSSTAILEMKLWSIIVPQMTPNVISPTGNPV